MEQKQKESIKEQKQKDKRQKCARAKCPNAGKDASECANCTGPVFWIENGKEQGHARACTSCPMNGKGLPVCWAACKGPSEVFGTGGQNMMTLGGLASEDEFLGCEIARDYLMSKAPKGQVTRLSPEAEEATLQLMRTFAGLTYNDLKVLHALLKAKHSAEAGRILGVTKQAINQASNRIAERKNELRAFLFPRT